MTDRVRDVFKQGKYLKILGIPLCILGLAQASNVPFLLLERLSAVNAVKSFHFKYFLQFYDTAVVTLPKTYSPASIFPIFFLLLVCKYDTTISIKLLQSF